MKTDDPIPSPQRFGEGGNYPPHPGGMLHIPLCLSLRSHLISTSPPDFSFLPSLGLPALPAQHPPPQLAPGEGCGARWSRVKTLWVQPPGMGRAGRGPTAAPVFLLWEAPQLAQHPAASPAHIPPLIPPIQEETSPEPPCLGPPGMSPAPPPRTC